MKNLNQDPGGSWQLFLDDFWGDKAQTTYIIIGFAVGTTMYAAGGRLLGGLFGHKTLGTVAGGFVGCVAGTAVAWFMSRV